MINRIVGYFKRKATIAPSLDDELAEKIEALQQQLAELRYDSAVEINVQVAQLELVMTDKIEEVEKKLDARIKKLERSDHRVRTQELLLNHIVVI